MNFGNWLSSGIGCWFCWSLLNACSEPIQRPDAANQGGATSGREGMEAAASSDAQGASGERSGPEDGRARLGQACAKDVDCDEGMRCLSSDADEGGQGAPAGGLCTADCEGDADCKVFDQSAVCASLSEAPLDRVFASVKVPRLCLLGCSLGSPGGAGKCHGRAELACRPFAPDGVEQCQQDGSCPNGGFCFRDRCRELACGPRCNADSECSAKRFCNPQTGLCDLEQPSPVPVGASCDGDIPNGIHCGDGTCLILFDADGVRQKGMCTQTCTLGQLCGEGQGACALPRFQDYAAGDIAYCLELCTCDGDCQNAADRCLSWQSTTLSSHYGSPGFCGTYQPDQVVLECARP